MRPPLPPCGGPSPRAERKRSETLAAALRICLAAVVFALAFAIPEPGPRFALLAATGAYLTFAPFVTWRWALYGAIASGAGTAAVYFGQGLVVPLMAEGTSAAASSPLPNESVVIRAAFVLIAGVVVGGLAQMRREPPTEAAVIADVASRLDIRLGLTASIGIVLQALIRMFDAKRAILVTYDKESGAVWLWATRRASETPEGERVGRTRLDGSGLKTYLSAPAGIGFHVTHHSSTRPQLDFVWVGVTGRETPPVDAAALIKAEGPFEELMSAGVEMPGDWSARVFLVEPSVARDRSGAVSLLQAVVRGLARPLHNVYLLRRIRARSVADERARIGRELHDSIVQSILGVQVQLHALALQASEVRRELALDINQLGLTLREEVLRLREMMQQMKPIAPDPEHLMDSIAGVVRRFETETGIRARLVTRNDRVPLLPPACLEVLRIVQESLVNVRRHSGARSVVIRFTVERHECHLTIDDDGRGFPFAGRLTMRELERTLQGPWVIKDRVRRLGGDITVESAPGRGSRLDIKVPVSTYALHG